MVDKHYDWTSHQADVRPDKIAIVDLDTGLANVSLWKMIDILNHSLVHLYLETWRWHRSLLVLQKPPMNTRSPIATNEFREGFL